MIQTGNNISQAELKELVNCGNDPWSFSKHIHVMHPVMGKVRFDLYPFQKVLLWQFIKNRFNIILKFRQAGVTELIALYCLWLALYHPNKIGRASCRERV